MFKYIVVPATGADTDTPVFQTALRIARASIGHVEFLHVSMDVADAAVAMSSVEFSGGSFGRIIDDLERDVAQRRSRAETRVRDFCAAEKVAFANAPGATQLTVEWRTAVGDERAMLAARGRMADLIVVGRVRDGRDVLEHVLMNSGRPVLITPAHVPARIGQRVVIAWKDTAEAARAVSSSEPFLQAADQVVIVCVAEGGSETTDSAERLQHALRWHNPAVSIRQVPSSHRTAAETLLATAASEGADLLVMGGYGHSRVREMVFGGFTQHVLNEGDLPVLMAH